MRIGEVSGGNGRSFATDLRVPVDLTGFNILAFGGAGNLGESFCYAASRAGARVAIAERDEPDRRQRGEFESQVAQIARNMADPGRHGLPPVVYGDITDVSDAIAMTRHVSEQFGRIDIVVDFAGIHHHPFDLVNDAPEDLAETFRKVIDINLVGAFHITIAAARVMAGQRSGHIIHLCSSGSRLSLYGSYAYNASKHGLEGLVKTAAAQLAPLGIRVNGIAPGTVETNLNRPLLRDEEGNPRPRAQSILAHTPTKRFATKEGVMETLLAMCIPQRHFTGNVVFADDGYNIEGHSWPEGNRAVYEGQDAVERLYRNLARRYGE